MHYLVNGNVQVKAENAAKPHSQRSKYFEKFLTSHFERGAFENGCDFGCGKLRYFNLITSICNNSYFLDSRIQLERRQIIHGENTSIINYLSDKYNSNYLYPYQIRSMDRHFDVSFCLYVLSTVPKAKYRVSILKRIWRSLKNEGILIVAHQYNNSYFKEMKQKPNASVYEDGTLLDSLRGQSFFVELDPRVTQEYLEKTGFEIVTKKNHDGSVFFIARALKS